MATQWSGFEGKDHDFGSERSSNFVQSTIPCGILPTLVAYKTTSGVVGPRYSSNSETQRADHEVPTKAPIEKKLTGSGHQKMVSERGLVL